MKKIILYIVIIFLIFIEANNYVMSKESFHQSISINQDNPNVILNNQYDSTRVLIELDVNGISYGHELLWKANTTGTNYEESAVVYLDGIAYIGSCSTHGAGYDMVFAVDTRNGSIIWSLPTGPGYVGPVIDDNRLYIGTSSHGYNPTNEYVYCINRLDGTILWRRNIYGGIAESIQYDEEKIYFSTDIVYALNKGDGAINWTYALDDYCVTKPILNDNAFITATSGGTMYKINVTDGEKIWEVHLPDFSWDNSITADNQGHIFIAVYNDKSINAYEEKTGKIIWSYRLHAKSLSFNAFHNNMLFISDTNGYVYALNASTGMLIWEKKIGDCCDISSPSISGGLVFIGTRDYQNGAFFALNETNGNIIWLYKIGSSVTAPPSIADGIMFCGTDDWNMYAFDFGIGTDDWPLHRYDASNTAFSPKGLTEWQFVSATCNTQYNVTNCLLKNTYDHDIIDIKLKLPDGVNANWYDSLGNLLKPNSDYFMIDTMPSQSSLKLIISDISIHQPYKPTITGPSIGITGREYEYTISSIDPNKRNLSYYVDWGDGSYTGWTTAHYSGEPFNISHIWNEKDKYLVKVKAKNILEIESEWSDPLSIVMPRTHSYNFLTLIHTHPFLINPLKQVINHFKININPTDSTEYWGLLIAVGEYLNNPEQDRPTMLTEVENIYDSLINSETWDSSHIMKIKGENATLENILEGFQWLMDMEDENDISLIYITTHGYYLEQDLPPKDEADGKDEILIPYEGFDNTNKFLWDDEINLFCSMMQSKGICLIVDSCFSGGFNDAYIKTVGDIQSEHWIADFLEELTNDAGRVILMSSEEDQVSYGSRFSHYIAEGLEGIADDNDDEIISAEELFFYAEPFVAQYGRQQPTMVDAYSGELPITNIINS